MLLPYTVLLGYWMARRWGSTVVQQHHLTARRSKDSLKRIECENSLSPWSLHTLSKLPMGFPTCHCLLIVMVSFKGSDLSFLAAELWPALLLHSHVPKAGRLSPQRHSIACSDLLTFLFHRLPQRSKKDLVFVALVWSTHCGGGELSRNFYYPGRAACVLMKLCQKFRQEDFSLFLMPVCHSFLSLMLTHILSLSRTIKGYALPHPYADRVHSR